MRTPPTPLFALEFDDALQASIFVDLVRMMLRHPEGSRYRAGSERAEIWSAGTCGGDARAGTRRLYVTSGAVAAAAEAEVRFRAVGEVPPALAPETLTLVVGGARLEETRARRRRRRGAADGERP